MKVPVYKAIATRLGAIENCIKSGSTNWQDRHERALRIIERENLPHGSGIDNGVRIEGVKNRISLYSGFHVMDENGFYDRWIDFRVIVTPDLQFGIDLNIIGNFGRDQQHLKSCLFELFNTCLNEMIKRR